MQRKKHALYIKSQLQNKAKRNRAATLESPAPIK